MSKMLNFSSNWVDVSYYSNKSLINYAGKYYEIAKLFYSTDK